MLYRFVICSDYFDYMDAQKSVLHSRCYHSFLFFSPSGSGMTNFLCTAMPGIDFDAYYLIMELVTEVYKEKTFMGLA